MIWRRVKPDVAVSQISCCAAIRDRLKSIDWLCMENQRNTCRKCRGYRGPIASNFGWTDDDMPSLYTCSADRRRLAMDAIGKLERNKK